MDNNFFGFALRNTDSPRPFLYLSAPWGADNAATARLMDRAQDVAALLMERGYHVYCPLVHHFGIISKIRTAYYITPFVDTVVLPHADALVALNCPECFEDFSIVRDVTMAVYLGLPLNLVTPGEYLAAHLSGELAVESDVHPSLWRDCGITNTTHFVRVAPPASGEF